MYCFSALFFSSIQFLIECGYLGVYYLSLIGNVGVRCNICIHHIDYKLLSCMKTYCHIHPSKLDYSYLVFIFEVRFIVLRSNKNKLNSDKNILSDIDNELDMIKALHFSIRVYRFFI